MSKVIAALMSMSLDGDVARSETGNRGNRKVKR
jgi:hypothetical protein